jgi:2-oxoglutarate decarboxylase
LTNIYSCVVANVGNQPRKRIFMIKLSVALLSLLITGAAMAQTPVPAAEPAQAAPAPATAVPPAAPAAAVPMTPAVVKAETQPEPAAAQAAPAAAKPAKVASKQQKSKLRSKTIAAR